jgi:hypothetical protein
MSDTPWSDRPIASQALNLMDAAHQMAMRPELTDAERAKFTAAAVVLRNVWLDIEERFRLAKPGTTTFSVLAQ